MISPFSSPDANTGAPTITDPAHPDTDAVNGAAVHDQTVHPSPTFASLGLHQALRVAIARLGFEEPTPIQRRAIPLAIQGHDVVGLAQTGTGKTLAFLAPAIHRLLQAPIAGHTPRILVLTPTRELAAQISELAEQLVKDTPLLLATIYGGAHMDKQTNALKRGVDVIVATPGRLQDHLRRRNLRLDSVAVLVLDEADRMLDMGFIDDMRAIVRHLPADRQTLLFGATMSSEIQRLSADFQRRPEIIEVARQLPPDTIEQVLFPLGRHQKEPMMAHLLDTDPTMTTVLIFTETKSEADILARQLGESGHQVAVMHGDRHQRERETALSALREGKVRALVATNVASRGLDIEGVTHVVNFDVPQSVDEYVHRIGRTARAGAIGRAYSFVTLGDETMIARIEQALERKLPRRIDPDFDYSGPVPSWAGPRPADIIAAMTRNRTAADFSRSLRRRR